MVPQKSLGNTLLPQHKRNNNDIPKIKVENISKSFGDTLVFKDVSFSIKQGKVLSIIGPSGGGKTTLLRCLNLLETVDSGSIFWDGQPLIEHLNDFRPIFHVDPDNFREKIGMVFQEYNLWPNKTILENIIEAPCHVKKTYRAEAETRAKYLCEKFGIGSKINEYPINLSGGQKQRAAFARALAMEPEVLLLDEVTSALDAEMVGEILDLITKLKFEGYTMILVTHHLGFAKFVSDEVLFLADHCVVEYGTPDEVLGSPSDYRTQNFVNSLLNVEPSKLLFDIRSSRLIPEASAKELYNKIDLDRIRHQVRTADEKVLREQMKSEYPYVRLLAYNLFRDYFSEEDYAILIKEYKESHDPYFKIPLIFQILAKFEREDDIADFLHYVKQHPDEYVNHNLQYFGGKRKIIKEVKSRLKKPDHYAKRFLYIYLLGLIGDESCMEDLEILSNDTVEIVKNEAKVAIKNIKNRVNKSDTASNAGK